MAISCVTAAVLGDGKTMAIIYITMQYVLLNPAETFLPKSYIVPCNLPWATKASIGNITAETRNPITTNHHEGPAFNPRKGGRIRLPAPNIIENAANPAMKEFLVKFMVIDGYFKIMG